MVVGFSNDGGRSFAPAALVHADHWQINACPHRGGSIALDRQGQIYMAWYTEGSQRQPQILFAVSANGQGFTSPQRLDLSTSSIPDHVRMAVDAAGRAVIVWEDSTATHRQVLLRYTTDRGRTFSPIQVLSHVIKAYAPAVAVSPRGDFVVAWHEEQFPMTKTVIQTIRLGNTK
jgi:hypothetical protein